MSALRITPRCPVLPGGSGNSLGSPCCQTSSMHCLLISMYADQGRAVHPWGSLLLLRLPVETPYLFKSKRPTERSAHTLRSCPQLKDNNTYLSLGRAHTFNPRRCVLQKLARISHPHFQWQSVCELRKSNYMEIYSSDTVGLREGIGIQRDRCAGGVEVGAESSR